MRGFVITILSVSLIMILVVLSMSIHNARLGTERALIEPLPLIYGAFLIDDTAYELNSVIGPHISLLEANDSMGLIMIDSLHSYNHSGDISAYGAFLSGDVADRTASDIATNLTNITGGTITVFINEDYTYANDHTQNESLFTREGGTGATSYEINLTMAGVRTNITHMAFNGSGTMNVTIRYADMNGTGTEQGSVFPGQPNTFRLDYAGGGSVTVAIGPESGNDGSLRIEAPGTGAGTAWSAVLPQLNATKRMGYAYDATISYVQGTVSKSCRIGK